MIHKHINYVKCSVGMRRRGIINFINLSFTPLQCIQGNAPDLPLRDAYCRSLHVSGQSFTVLLVSNAHWVLYYPCYVVNILFTPLLHWMLCIYVCRKSLRSQVIVESAFTFTGHFPGSRLVFFNPPNCVLLSQTVCLWDRPSQTLRIFNPQL